MDRRTLFRADQVDLDRHAFAGLARFVIGQHDAHRGLAAADQFGLAEDSQGVTDFFLDADSGFASIAEATVDSLTDPFTGTFALEVGALQQSVASLTTRIEQLDEIIEVRRERMLLEFINMETILSALASQQQAISGISRLTIN